MSFHYKKFAKEIFEDFKNILTKEEADSLLSLDEEYGKDTPVSTGKRLIINNVSIFGEKNLSENQEYSGAKINFSQPFKSGVNILIADNFKGKSSLFKLIKYALTGSNSLKPNIKKWISHSFINFSINEIKYTAYLDLTKRSLSGYLLNGFVKSIKEFEEYNKEVVFEASSEDSYSEKMKDFFFNQFTYYSLKWTQKSPSKSSNELLEVGASWKTYFGSILLESKNSHEMYGAQGKKMFQMLLGIELTYPINRLTIKKEMLIYEKAKELSHKDSQKKNKEKQLYNLRKQLKSINDEIAKEEKENQPKINITPVIKEYNEVLKHIKIENKKAQEITINKPDYILLLPKKIHLNFKWIFCVYKQLGAYNKLS